MPREFDRYDEREDYDDVRGGGHVEPHRGVVILVLGILGIMMCGVLGIPAWVMGKRDLDLIARGLMDREGKGLTQAGYVLGIVGTIFFILQISFVGLYIAGVAIFFAGK